MGVMDDILKEDVPSEIKHYGVKGMKWGVTRAKDNSGDSEGKSSGGFDKSKPFVFKQGENGPVMFVGGPGGEGQEEYEEFLKALRALMDDKSLSPDEILKRSEALKSDFIKKMTKKYDLKGENLGRKPDGSPKSAKEQGDFFKDVQKNVDSFVKDTQKNVGNFYKDSQKNVGKFLDSAGKELKRPFGSKTTTSRLVTGKDGKRYNEIKTVRKDGLGKVTSKEVKREPVKKVKVSKKTEEAIIKALSKAKETKHSDLRYQGDFLEHYGVKGQRWGFRKATTRGGTPPSKRKAKGEVDEGENSSSKRVQTPSHKSKTKDLSDQELKDRIQRLQNERLYAQLTAKPENVVVGIIKRSAKKSAEEALTQVSTKLLKQALGAGAEKLLSKKASETIKNTSMDDFAKVFAEAKKSAPKFKMPEAPKPEGPAGKSNFGTPENPIFFTATRSDPTPRPTIKLKEITR